MQSSLQPMNYHLITWKFLGFWPPDSNPFWYHCYTFIVFLIPLISFPLLILANLFSVTNLNDAIETLLPSSTVVIATIKGYLLYRNRYKIKKLFTILSDMDMEVKTDAQKMIINRAVRESQRLLKFVICIYYGGVTMAMVIAVIAKEKMWPSWFPFKYEYHENLTMYYIVLMYQYLSNMVHAVIDSTVDMYGSTLNKLLGCHLDVLGLKLTNLMKYDDDDDDKKVLDKNKLEEIYYANLRECVEYHTLCIRFSQHLDQILSVHYFIQFGVSGFVLCVAAYQLSVLKDFTKFVWVCEYMLAMTLEILIPCYYGSVLIRKSEKLTQQLFNSNWIGRSKKFQSSIRIMLQRSLKPIIPLAGGMFAIALPTFVSIGRAAYSLFAFLKNL